MLNPIILGLMKVLELAFNIVQLLIIVSVLTSLLNADPYNPIVKFIRDATEPMYRPFRKLTAKIPGPFDWAPLCAIFTLIFLQVVILNMLKNLIT